MSPMRPLLRHYDKMLLGLAATGLLGVVAWQLAGAQNTVKVGSQEGVAPGEAWSKVPTNTIATLYAIHGDGGEHVVVVGDEGGDRRRGPEAAVQRHGCRDRRVGRLEVGPTATTVHVTATPLVRPVTTIGDPTPEALCDPQRAM